MKFRAASIPEPLERTEEDIRSRVLTAQLRSKSVFQRHGFTCLESMPPAYMLNFDQFWGAERRPGTKSVQKAFAHL